MGLSIYINKAMGSLSSFFGGEKLEAMKTFWKLQKDLGLNVALESFWKVLAMVEEDMFHDPLSCSECHV